MPVRCHALRSARLDVRDRVTPFANGRSNGSEAPGTPRITPASSRKKARILMFAGKLVAASALALSALAPSFSFAAQTPKQAPCLLGEYLVTAVSPYLAQDQIGKASFPRVHGASVYVAAEPGLTAEWLKLRVEQHIAVMQRGDMPDCALDVGPMRVEVDSTGNGFAVRLISSDTRSAAQILERARLLVPE